MSTSEAELEKKRQMKGTEKENPGLNVLEAKIEQERNTEKKL